MKIWSIGWTGIELGFISYQKYLVITGRHWPSTSIEEKYDAANLNNRHKCEYRSKRAPKVYILYQIIKTKNFKYFLNMHSGFCKIFFWYFVQTMPCKFFKVLYMVYLCHLDFEGRAENYSFIDTLVKDYLLYVQWHIQKLIEYRRSCI